MRNLLIDVIFMTTVAGVGGTGLGGVISCFFRKDSDRMISLLLSFAAGVMTAVVCFDLLTDALFPEGSDRQTSLALILAGVLMGYGVIGLLNAVVDGRRQAQGVRKNGGDLFLAGVVMAAAIALHNIPEGMVIGAAFAGTKSSGLLPRSGLMMAVVIGLHNIPEGMAVAVPLVSGKMHRPAAILVTALTGMPTILGAILGYFLGSMGPLSLAISLSFASGAMLYVVYGELLPEASLMWQSKLPALAAIIGIMTGMIIVYA
ncbi:zinc transporter, ZIP family [Oscillibacter sp. PC13]|uniref:ZIP family metal transporter n=1 Tax=Oscillibacter sp. PC13 TaxID=1855299 RepID=UPI0008E7BFB0|nr:ZIP family metal transporter [Oscillibacter sp. PC13]SFP18861.1 zinc transporter, ZIP family [Oscillibacter sp. PC13]